MRLPHRRQDARRKLLSIYISHQFYISAILIAILYVWKISLVLVRVRVRDRFQGVGVAAR